MRRPMGQSIPQWGRFRVMLKQSYRDTRIILQIKSLTILSLWYGRIIKRIGFIFKNSFKTFIRSHQG
jgi:hypothetical protein